MANYFPLIWAAELLAGYGMYKWAHWVEDRYYERVDKEVEEYMEWIKQVKGVW